jgi:hypothetical protein
VIDRFVWQELRFVYTTFLLQVSKHDRWRTPRLNWESDEWGWFTLEEAFRLPLHFGARAALAALATRISST